MITQGSMSMLNFGKMEGSAYRAHMLIQKYGFSKQCFVGRPDAVFQYWRR